LRCITNSLRVAVPAASRVAFEAVRSNMRAMHTHVAAPFSTVPVSFCWRVGFYFLN
jgi:hypothetical protein